MVPTNSHLRRLLISTMPKSVVVVEDIDCSLDLSDRKKSSGGRRGQHAAGELSPPVTAAMPVIGHESISLSSVINLVDLLWSSYVSERPMIFTTNNPERLDPTRLLAGCMDRNIELGYYSPSPS
uniref:ATPase AAA-type core domain-containing protein n=1 Tax=Aegilops tauschii subsp. strangulata TaxID=200361 RepID=A0A453IBL2_AEGTS